MGVIGAQIGKQQLSRSLDHNIFAFPEARLLHAYNMTLRYELYCSWPYPSEWGSSLHEVSAPAELTDANTSSIIVVLMQNANMVNIVCSQLLAFSIIYGLWLPYSLPLPRLPILEWTLQLQVINSATWMSSLSTRSPILS